MSLPIYFPFRNKDENCDAMSTQFLDELRLTLEWTDRGKILLDALECGDLNLHCYPCASGGVDGPFLFTFVLKIDRILIKLALECNMPRGFPALWWPTRKIKFFGFRPKFENDRQEEVSLELEVDGVAWFKKFSGYLGQLLTWVCPITGGHYWSTASKNSGDASHEERITVRDCARLFEP